MAQVLGIVGAMMRGQLQDVGSQPLMSEPGKPRWYNTAQWARNAMVIQGLLRNDSPRGTWEVTEEGLQYLRDGPADDRP
jgi:hypothetical protein